MLLDNRKTRRDLEDLRHQIQSLSYLIKMDNIHPENYENPLVSKRIKLELCLENLLTMVKREKETERRTNRSD
jgi:hypothetical protein